MIEEAERRGTDWRLVFLGRVRQRMPYVDELVARHAGRVEVWPSRELGRFDLTGLWSGMPGGGRLRLRLRSRAAAHRAGGLRRAAGREAQLVVERFAARPTSLEPNRPFEVPSPAAGRS